MSGVSTGTTAAGATTATPLGGGSSGSAGSMGRMGGMGGMGMMGGMGGGGAEGGTGRRIPPWLVERTEGIWGESAVITPPVIGDDQPVAAPPPTRTGSRPTTRVGNLSQ
jgi:hypothetical protein